jgi:hypothetical protein
MSPNDWVEYKRLVLAELERLDDLTKTLRNALGTVENRCVRHHAEPRTDAAPKWKFWGIIAGIVGAIITTIIGLIFEWYRVS